MRACAGTLLIAALRTALTASGSLITDRAYRGPFFFPPCSVSVGGRAQRHIPCRRHSPRDTLTAEKGRPAHVDDCVCKDVLDAASLAVGQLKDIPSDRRPQKRAV